MQKYRENIFSKLTIRNECLYEISNDNAVGVVRSAKVWYGSQVKISNRFVALESIRKNIKASATESLCY
jgi:hypothetical protein